MPSQAQPHHLALDAQALREAVEAHQRYLNGRSGGRRLSLTYADLSNCTLEGLDLREADFAGANFHGATLARASVLLREAGAVSVTTAVVVDKRLPEALLKADHAAFVDVHDFIIGYGMDDAGMSRALPYIGRVK